MDKEYITSERFIHDNLIRISERVVERACTMWEEGMKLTAHAIAWPADVVRADDGKAIEGAIILPMPSQEHWSRALSALVERTSAYGLFLLEMRERDIHAVFESHHGSHAWSVPLERHGDRIVLGEPRTSDDVESIGLLWSPKKSES